ncbi:3-hydroxyacyl-CoA dehydrogenase [Sphingobium jiangsuense]|uniref:NAD(P)-dependent dehydrogenase (Short-subunit alcohol dehydrogenase family) n=1 Tax=Sphingobium jiangsuense TaxID=870476 RepID=A0A7W6BS64_9SPHN|nr:SDR family NAD(P)-dependent oxidoreductase [Sphingobium jiangsuense]MBB3926829.1 NAD(P)-dependent dehydrogenase (short-subunit alcohol dehydrogenase family) [Sphingobium jiangsuense]GLS98837.1 3-hydroxyacyl-CoA dehydrogenase [Sphingobium jiangsuense]
MDVSGVAAIVTGGASGLGEATARALAAAGAKVAIFDLNAERGEAVAAAIGGAFCAVDVTDEASLDAGFARARAVHGQERVLVNCAGIATGEKTASRDRETGAPTAHRIAAFARTVTINLIGTFACTAKSAAGMLTLDPLEDGERGVIINTASVAAEDGQIGQAAYAASKAGVKGMTLPIARDLMGEGIRCNVILPGILGTPMLLGLPQNVQDSLGATVPFPKRLGKPSEYAETALFLIRNSYMNGASVRLDGALRMAPR